MFPPVQKWKTAFRAEGISSVPPWSGEAYSDTFFTPPIRSFRDGMSFRPQQGRFLIKLACRWSCIAGIESHLNLARQRPSKPNWRALLRRRLLPARASAALSNHAKIPDDTEVVPPNAPPLTTPPRSAAPARARCSLGRTSRAE